MPNFDTYDAETRRLIDEPRHHGGLGYFQKTVGVDDTKGFFSFNACTEAAGDFGGRCDVGWVGPISFHQLDEDGICNCGGIDSDVSTDEVCGYGYASVETIVYAAPFYAAPPIGYICYSEARDPSVEELFCRHHWNSNARTIQELLKLMYEWRDCHLDLNDQSQIATTADALLAEMEVPAEVEDWVRVNVPAGPVLRFLAGDANARDRQSDIPDLPDFVSHWLWTKTINQPKAFGVLGTQPSV